METIEERMNFYVRTNLSDKAARFLALTFPKISPNMWTVIGLFATLGAFVVIVKCGLFIGAFATLISSLVDSVDGGVARARNSATSFGAFLDEMSDRFGEMFIFAAIFWVVEKCWSVYAAPISSFMASYINAAAKARGFRPSAGTVTGRPGRIVLLFLLMLGSPWLPISQTLWLIVALNFFTFFKRGYEVYRQM